MSEALFSDKETEDLATHVEKCALRYAELKKDMANTMKRLLRLELWMVGGMAAIIGLLAKMAFWPS